jgi:hypothetical protein
MKIKKYYQKLKSNLWSWILLSTGVGLSVMVLCGLLFLPRFLKTPNMIEFITRSEYSYYVFFKVILLFLIFLYIFYLMFLLLSVNFIKELNLQARDLVSLDKYVQFKEDYRFELMGDDRKYITDNSDQIDSYHYLRRITLRKPLNWVEKLIIVTMLLTYVLYLTSVFYPDFLQKSLIYRGLMLLQINLVLFVFFFRRINSLVHASQKVDDLLDNPQGVR